MGAEGQVSQALSSRVRRPEYVITTVWTRRAIGLRRLRRGAVAVRVGGRRIALLVARVAWLLHRTEESARLADFKTW